jgi:thioredoxin reductase
MYDLIIVGGGPAALSAATYAQGKQLKALVICETLGGKAGSRQQLVGQLGDEYLPGAEAVQAFERRILQSDQLLHDRVTTVKKAGELFSVTTEQHGVYESVAVLIATGATPIELYAPGAQEFLGHGLGYSATTHAQLLAGKTVVIIGNTLRALRGAAEVAPTAAQIFLVVPDATLLSSSLAQTLQRHPHVRIFAGAQVRGIGGGFNVEEVVIEHDRQIVRLPADAAFVDLGLYAKTGMVRALLDLAPGQFIPIDERNATSVPGLFAAGDVTTAFGEQTLIAIGEGARAALSAYDYILERTALHAKEAHVVT